MVAGLNAAVAPVGRPLALNDTVWAPPLVMAAEIEVVAGEPCTALIDEGLALSEKSFAGGVPVMTNDTVAECEPEGAVPVMVTVEVPAAALPELSVSVDVPLPVTEVG